MTVRELIQHLQAFHPETKVLVFEAFDSNGPNTWEEPEFVAAEDGTIHIDVKFIP